MIDAAFEEITKMDYGFDAPEDLLTGIVFSRTAFGSRICVCPNRPSELPELPDRKSRLLDPWKRSRCRLVGWFHKTIAYFHWQSFPLLWWWNIFWLSGWSYTSSRKMVDPARWTLQILRTTYSFSIHKRMWMEHNIIAMWRTISIWLGTGVEETQFVQPFIGPETAIF